MRWGLKFFSRLKFIRLTMHHFLTYCLCLLFSLTGVLCSADDVEGVTTTASTRCQSFKDRFERPPTPILWAMLIVVFMTLVTMLIMRLYLKMFHEQPEDDSDPEGGRFSSISPVLWVAFGFCILTMVVLTGFFVVMVRRGCIIKLQGYPETDELEPIINEDLQGTETVALKDDDGSEQSEHHEIINDQSDNNDNNDTSSDGNDNNENADIDNSGDSLIQKVELD